MSGKFTGAISPTNDLSKNLVRRIRKEQPSLQLISKWHQEWLERGLDKKITFQDFKKQKCKQYHLERNSKKKR